MPIYFDFTQDWIVVKALLLTEAKFDEKMLFYSRTTGASEFVMWGLEPSEYFNEYDPNMYFTSSIPVAVYKKVTVAGTDEWITSFRFTQT